MSFSIQYALSDDQVIRSIFNDGKLIHSSTINIPIKIDKEQPLSSLFDQAWLLSSSEPLPNCPSKDIHAIDLFCGCGGLTLGVKEAARSLGFSFHTVFACDTNFRALELYHKNFKPDIADSAPIEKQINGNLREVLTKEERAFCEKVGKIDILVAGPPCQGNSNLNNHTRRTDPKNLLYLRAVRCAEILTPESVIIENVPGVKYEAHGVLQTAMGRFSELGYSIGFGVVRMKDIGVPQNRKRMFLIASKKGEVNLQKAVSLFTVPERPLSWACEDLLNAYDDNSIFNSSAEHSARNLERIKYLFDHDLYELPDSERPDCHRLKPHTYPGVYGRMHWDKPAPTITGGFGSCGQGRFVHPLRPRTLTPHEAARVQFFPDFFDFQGVCRREIQQIIGNAVPAKAGFTVSFPLFTNLL